MLQKFDKWNKTKSKMKLHPMLFCGIMKQEFSGVHPAGKSRNICLQNCHPSRLLRINP